MFSTHGTLLVHFFLLVCLFLFVCLFGFGCWLGFFVVVCLFVFVLFWVFFFFSDMEVLYLVVFHYLFSKTAPRCFEPGIDFFFCSAFEMSGLSEAFEFCHFFSFFFSDQLVYRYYLHGLLCLSLV